MSERESLTTVLHLATDRVDDPGLERLALDIGRRRRTRRRGLVAGALAAGVTAAVIVVVHVSGGPSAIPPPVTHTPSPSAGPRVWPEWDPRDLAALAPAPEEVVPTLPNRIQPPVASPLLTDEPIATAVLVTVVDGRVQVLSTQGAWRTVKIPGVGPDVTAVLSPAGTRLVVKPDGPVVAGTTVVDLATGASRRLDAPRDLGRPFDPGWFFVDEHTLLLLNAQRGWFVDARTGAAKPAPPGIAWGSAEGIDAGGSVLVSAGWGKARLLTEWDGTTERTVSMDRIGRLTTLQADDETVAGTSYNRGPLRVVVADRATLTPITVLPVKDRQGIYAAGLSVLATSDDGLVVLRVITQVPGQQTGFLVVAWDPATDQRYLVSRTTSPFQVDFATGVLRDDG